MKNKLCVFGKENSVYTDVVVKELDDLGVKFDLIIENQISKQIKKYKIINILKTKAGRYKTIPIISPYRYLYIYKEIKFKKSEYYKRLIKKYNSNFKKKFIVFETDNINSRENIEFIKERNYDFCVFAGVGIVKNDVINCFKKKCINAHPAKLPECKGGGAIENSLLKSQPISSTVHIANEKIDDGPILLIKKLELSKKDTFESVTLKNLILCGETLAKVYFDIHNGVEFKLKQNKGKINYWKDLSLKKQIKARNMLKKIIQKNGR